MVEINVSPDAEALARTVAEQLVQRLAAIQASGKVPSVALTGGTIADAIYQAVAKLPSSDVVWMRVDFWWGDERYVPADSATATTGRSNATCSTGSGWTPRGCTRCRRVTTCRSTGG